MGMDHRTVVCSMRHHKAILKHCIASCRRSGSSTSPMLSVDARERLLVEVLQRYGVAHTVTTLPVGDILCTYEDGTSWVAERKRADDLANSIKEWQSNSRTLRQFNA